MLELRGLTKRFGSLVAVDNLTLDIPPGRVTGFLGPNGAGKTTTLRMTLGLISPTAGTATFDGQTYRKLDVPMRQVGAALEATNFHPGRTALGHLRSLAPSAHVTDARCREMLTFVGLAEVGSRRVGKFSLGMRARLGLATALLGDPATLLLDEPTNGLDPEGIAWMRAMVRGLAAEGRTVLISSHLLAEVHQTVDDVVILARGSAVYAGPLAEIDKGGGNRTLVATPDPPAFAALAAARGWGLSSDKEGFTVTGTTSSEIGEAAHAAGIVLHQLADQGSSLEAAFLAMTEGQGLGQ
ncbi:MAG: ATP-binding cassette domain-containing protein [Bifidobacteriaceae bacterium]|nr:ATP-binding cassette domain-containing protein [Bifidobacteriaceae bacterium]